jgi:N-hydroxyarylamine O-acetyltransferase
VNSRLAAYCQRIGLAAPPAADAAGLELLQATHRRMIAFENLDVRLGRPLALDSEGVFAKLVTGGRGGYCFEHNRLFADRLADLGLATRPLLARVRLGQPAEACPPRAHMLLLADLSGDAWIADVGFGGSYVPALPLSDGAEAATADGARHRLRRIGEPGTLAGEWLLERAGPMATPGGHAVPDGGWQAQYSFDLTEVAEADIAQANHWTATAPASRFTELHIVTRVLPDGFASLVDRSLTVSRRGLSEAREIENRQAYGKVLRDMFGLALAPGDLARLPLFQAKSGG